MRNTRPFLAAAAVVLALGGCVLLDLVMLPIKLIFGGLEALGKGVSSLVATNVTAEPIEGPAPAVTPLRDGRWLVEAPAERSRFRVTIAADGFETRTFTWPDDFTRTPTDGAGVAHVDCVLAALPALGAAPR